MSAVAVARPAPLSAMRRHLGAAARAGAYLLLGLPLGLLALLWLPAVAVAGAEVLRRPIAVARTLLNRVLGAHVPPAPAQLPPKVGLFFVLRLPLAIAGLVAIALPLGFAVLVAVEAGRGLTAGGESYLGPWALDASLSAGLVVLLVPALVIAVASLEAYGSAARKVARRMLAPVSGGGAVRDALAESLGDRTLTIAYWLPERSLFVDEHGRAVELPQPQSGRSWTAVENGGRRVAAIIHDAELEARPELVQAAATGAVLALENEQLKADLRARLEELRRSRKRIVQASLEARRRIERDLHDGAQQQLVSLSVDLQLLKARIDNDEVRALVEETAAKLAAALAELRELARGIHPAILSDRGLAPALESLAARAPLPVELDLRVEGRLPESTEAAAYFIAAEALTNIARYANAGLARLSLRQHGDRLEVEISDDGVGGAEPRAGSGLRGLADRIAAVDGTLTIESPPGHGTRILAVIPCEEKEES